MISRGQGESDHQSRLKVVSHRPWMLPVLSLLVFAALALTSVATYFWSGHTLRQQVLQAYEQLSELEIALRQEEQKNRMLQQNVANFSVRAQLEQKASNAVREEVAALNQRISELEEDIRFYRGIMEPGEDRKGLAIGDVKLLPQNQGQEVEYRIVFQQLATRHQVIQGVAVIEVLGEKAGESVVLELSAMDERLNENTIKLRFKYFQTVEGVMTVPQGFAPKSIRIKARTNGKQPQSVEQTVDWYVMEV